MSKPPGSTMTFADDRGIARPVRVPLLNAPSVRLPEKSGSPQLPSIPPRVETPRNVSAPPEPASKRSRNATALQRASAMGRPKIRMP